MPRARSGGFRLCLTILIGSVLCLLAAVRPAAQESSAGPGLVACVFPIVDLSESEDNARFQEIIRRQLELELVNAGFQVLDPARRNTALEALGYRDRDLTEGTKAIAAGDALGAHIVFTGFYRVEGQRIVLALKAYDVLQQAFVTGVMRTGTVDLSVYTLIDAVVGRMVPEIRLLSLDPAALEADPVREITLYSPDEGMDVYLAGQQFAGRISEGALTLPYFPLAVGSTIQIEKRKDGYYTSREEIRIQTARVEATLRPLTRRTRWATELSWTTKQLLGFGLAQRWYPVTDVLFLAAENYFYLQHNFSEGGRPVLHDDLRLLVGGYPFSDVEARFRVGLSTGLGVILSELTVPGQPVFTDFYWSLVGTWIEWNWPRWIAYLRTEGRYGFGIGRNLLGRGMLADGPLVSLGVVYKW